MTPPARHRQERPRLLRASVVGMLSILVAVITALVIAAAGSEPPGSPVAETSSMVNATLKPLPTPRARPDVSTATKPSRGSPVPENGPGLFVKAKGSTQTVGRGNLVAYRVEVEDTIPIGTAAFAAAVDRTLAHPRGWTARGRYAFRREPSAALRIVLATPATTDELCAPLKTGGEVSCRNGNDVVINAKRWALGARSYGDDLASYRLYVINHEVGHSLGLPHTACPSAGAKAPVMLQQTLGLQGCLASPWPY